MDVQILEGIRFRPNLEGIREKLRIRDGTRHTARFAQLVQEAEAIARPRALYRVAYVDSMGESSVVLDGILFESRVLRVNLDKAHRVFAFLCTCGNELHEWAAAQEGTLLQYYAGEIAEAALRQMLNVLKDHLDERYRLGNTSTMSPGSLPDWPIQAQRPLFSLFGKAAEILGVQLTGSLLMIPTKSVSGIRFPTDQSFASCQLCARERCPSRQAPYDGQLLGTKYRLGKEARTETTGGETTP